MPRMQDRHGLHKVCVFLVQGIQIPSMGHPKYRNRLSEAPGLTIPKTQTSFGTKDSTSVVVSET